MCDSQEGALLYGAAPVAGDWDCQLAGQHVGIAHGHVLMCVDSDGDRGFDTLDEAREAARSVARSITDKIGAAKLCEPPKASMGAGRKQDYGLRRRDERGVFLPKQT